MSRTLWFAAGAGVGLYAVARARRAAEALTPDGLADRLSGLALGLHLFREELRAGMEGSETEVRARLAGAFPGDAAGRSDARPALTSSRPDSPASRPADSPTDSDRDREATD